MTVKLEPLTIIATIAVIALLIVPAAKKHKAKKQDPIEQQVKTTQN